MVAFISDNDAHMDYTQKIQKIEEEKIRRKSQMVEVFSTLPVNEFLHTLKWSFTYPFHTGESKEKVKDPPSRIKFHYLLLKTVSYTNLKHT